MSNNQPHKRPVIFGEVLFDRFPDGSVVLGGAPFNVAWNLQAFGQAPILISRVGQDPLGDSIRAIMTDWSMDTSQLQSDPSHPTGTVDVSFKDGEPHYEIVVDSAYDFVETAGLADIQNAAVLYHGSLALRGDKTRQTFHALLQQLPVRRFVDVNLRAPWWQKQAILELINGAAWVKLNEDELNVLTESDQDHNDADTELRQRYGLQALIVTRGSRGAELLLDNSAEDSQLEDRRLGVAPAQSTQVVDTVGAGDAFTSVILLGLLNEWSHRTTLERAQAFASAVVGLRGATTRDPDFYARFAAEWGIGR
jgi:fructokinase